MEFRMVNSMFLFFTFHERSLWVTVVCSTAHVGMTKVGKGQL